MLPPRRTSYRGWQAALPFMKSTSESVVRRRAARKGLQVCRVSMGSRWYNDLGPYALRDTNHNMYIARNCSLEELA